MTGVTLDDLLVERAAERPDRPLFTWLPDRRAPEQSMTYGEFDAAVRRMAGVLRARCAPRDRVVLLYPTGLEFLVAMFACFRSGAVAVPAMPLDTVRAASGVPRLRAILGDARPALVLAASPAVRDELGDACPAARAIPWAFGSEACGASCEGAGRAAAAIAVAPDDVALLQYTSGSTSEPKGVMVSHANLLHNEAMIRRAFDQSDASVTVSWLPMHHDMGLIGMALQPLFSGGRAVFMPPLGFLRRPVQWLEAITRFSATTITAPNFGYDACVRRVGPEDRGAIDLSSVREALNGSEPVRARTLRAFAEAFRPCGFREAALVPCYGLAEATLYVSGGHPRAERARVERFEAEALSAGRVVPAADGGGPARSLVSCGALDEDEVVAIVDPGTLRRSAPDRIGEIWISSASVARGYFDRPDETEATFRAAIAGEPDERRYLRTGDLGFVSGGELFVTGRVKELVIVRGKKHHPHDLEASATSADPRLGDAACVAFAIEGDGGEGDGGEGDGGEQLVVALELGRPHASGLAELRAVVREAVIRDHGIAPVVAFVVRGSIARTSSGKPRRLELRARWLAGQVAEVEPAASAGAP